MESVIQKMKEENDEKRIRRESHIFKTSVHRGVECSLCNMRPIIGIRFKSVSKQNYDLCNDCESKIGGDDVFLKIKRPEDYEKFLADLRKVPGVENAQLLNRLK